MSFLNVKWNLMKTMAKGSTPGEEDGQENPPIYRAYGVTRRVRPWAERTKLTFLKFLALWMMSTWCVVILFSLTAFFLYYPEMWVKLLALLLLVILASFLLTRTVRKRRKFTKKLKKLCKKRGYSIRYEQNFFQSLVWSADRQDFVLEREKTAYYVRYLTIRKYRSTLYFEKQDLFRLVKEPSRNRIIRIFFDFAKTKYYPLDFQVPAREDGKKTVKVLVINPVCQEMNVKDPDGGYEATGNGGAHFGFTVYTGSGFLDAIEREEE